MITGWWFNTTNNQYNGILTDVEACYYTTQYVYIKTSGVPNYYQDGVNVNDASDLDATWQIPRVPSAASNPSGVMGGQMGLMFDGSVFFHPGDAQSYNNAGVWNRLAYFFEGPDMDAYNGHSTPTNMYHHHFDNLALHNFDSTTHSPIVAYAWDGYPVYGPFGFKNTDGSGGTIRMRSSYKTQSYTTRTNGPSVGGQYPMGCFIEDWVYTSGYGNLDEHNGRFCVTPEYPNGTYAYFTALDDNYDPYYPYFIGPTFYGTILASNLGPTGGSASIPETATQYNPSSTASIQDIFDIEANCTLFPIPVISELNIQLKEDKPYILTLMDIKGIVLYNKTIGKSTLIDMSSYPYGTYFIKLEDISAQSGFVKRIIKR